MNHECDLSNKIASISYEKYRSLSKRGKPQDKKEWTVLSAILMSIEDFEVVSLCTGTKCLGYSHLSNKGDTLLDSHAEILARRGFCRFIYHHLCLILNKQTSNVLYFDEESKTFKLRDGVKFHLFISNIPCGDAAIFPKEEVSESTSLSFKRKASPDKNALKKLKPSMSNEYDVPSETSCNSSFGKDIYRTGAKCIESDIQDPKRPGSHYHVTGVLRTKPGRGDPTWSMSCSDKIALWNVCGLQGALLSIFIPKFIYLSSIVFGRCPFNQASVKRAIIERVAHVQKLNPDYIVNEPVIYQSSLPFEHSKDYMEEIFKNQKVAPCSSSIVWCHSPHFLEVSVNGKKQGTTKKNIFKLSSRLSICKSALFECFMELLPKLNEGTVDWNHCLNRNDMTYLDYKRMAKNYQLVKKALFEIFSGWKRKPEDFQKFIVTKDE